MNGLRFGWSTRSCVSRKTLNHVMCLPLQVAALKLSLDELRLLKETVGRITSRKVAYHISLGYHLRPGQVAAPTVGKRRALYTCASS